MSCGEHKLEFNIIVVHFEDRPGHGSIELTGQCTVCGVRLVWQGQRGASAPYPVCSPDRLELRAPVTFGYDVEIIPGVTALYNGGDVMSRETTAAEANLRLLADRLKDACVGYPNAQIPWPHRLLHDVADALRAAAPTNESPAPQAKTKESET